MDLPTDDFGVFAPTLEALARKHGMELRYVDHDGDQYYAMSWRTHSGRNAYLTFSRLQEGESPAHRFALRATSFPVGTPISESNSGGLLIAELVAGENASALAYRLEAGRDWAENWREVERPATVLDIVEFIEAGGWKSERTAVGPGQTDYETAFSRLTGALGDPDFVPKLRAVKALAALGDGRAVAAIRNMAPLPGAGAGFVLKYLHQLENQLELG